MDPALITAAGAVIVSALGVIGNLILNRAKADQSEVELLVAKIKTLEEVVAECEMDRVHIRRKLIRERVARQALEADLREQLDGASAASAATADHLRELAGQVDSLQAECAELASVAAALTLQLTTAGLKPVAEVRKRNEKGQFSK